MKDGEALGAEAEAPEPRSLTADDMRPVFEAILEYADARRDFAAATGRHKRADWTHELWDRYRRMAEAEAWLLTFADAIRGQK